MPACAILQPRLASPLPPAASQPVRLAGPRTPNLPAQLPPLPGRLCSPPRPARAASRTWPPRSCSPTSLRFRARPAASQGGGGPRELPASWPPSPVWAWTWQQLASARGLQPQSCRRRLAAAYAQHPPRATSRPHCLRMLFFGVASCECRPVLCLCQCHPSYKALTFIHSTLLRVCATHTASPALIFPCPTLNGGHHSRARPSFGPPIRGHVSVCPCLTPRAHATCCGCCSHDSPMRWRA